MRAGVNPASCGNGRSLRPLFGCGFRRSGRRSGILCGKTALCRGSAAITVAMAGADELLRLDPENRVLADRELLVDLGRIGRVERYVHTWCGRTLRGLQVRRGIGRFVLCRSNAVIRGGRRRARGADADRRKNCDEQAESPAAAIPPPSPIRYAKCQRHRMMNFISYPEVAWLSKVIWSSSRSCGHSRLTKRQTSPLPHRGRGRGPARSAGKVRGRVRERSLCLTRPLTRRALRAHHPLPRCGRGAGTCITTNVHAS
jgi:hypothetical protein